MLPRMIVFIAAATSGSEQFSGGEMDSDSASVSPRIHDSF